MYFKDTQTPTSGYNCLQETCINVRCVECLAMMRWMLSYLCSVCSNHMYVDVLLTLFLRFSLYTGWNGSGPVWHDGIAHIYSWSREWSKPGGFSTRKVCWVYVKLCTLWSHLKSQARFETKTAKRSLYIGTIFFVLCCSDLTTLGLNLNSPE